MSQMAGPILGVYCGRNCLLDVSLSVDWSVLDVSGHHLLGGLNAGILGLCSLLLVSESHCVVLCLSSPALILDRTIQSVANPNCVLVIVMSLSVARFVCVFASCFKITVDGPRIHMFAIAMMLANWFAAQIHQQTRLTIRAALFCTSCERYRQRFC